MKDLQTSGPLQSKNADQERRQLALLKLYEKALAAAPAKDRAEETGVAGPGGTLEPATRNGGGAVKGERTNGRNDPRSV